MQWASVEFFLNTSHVVRPWCIEAEAGMESLPSRGPSAQWGRTGKLRSSHSTELDKGLRTEGHSQSPLTFSLHGWEGGEFLSVSVQRFYIVPSAELSEFP